MPGTRHAKNNTALGFFTKHERDRLQWGTKRMRLGKDSIKKFDACAICLKLCQNPMVCPQGDLFCKECIYESLLNQKHRIKAKIIEQESLIISNNAEKEELRRKESIDGLMKFDRLETSVVMDNISNSKDSSKIISNEKEKEKAKEKEQDKQLGCFWIPQLTPNNSKNNNKNKNKNTNNNLDKMNKLVKNQLHCYCPGCNEKLKLKHLTKVKFSLITHDDDVNVNKSQKEKEKNKEKESSARTKTKTTRSNMNSSREITFRSGLGATIQSVQTKNEKRYQCPCCNKTLTNALKIVCLKNCGHIICLQCVSKFISKVCGIVYCTVLVVFVVFCCFKKMHSCKDNYWCIEMMFCFCFCFVLLCFVLFVFDEQDKKLYLV